LNCVALALGRLRRSAQRESRAVADPQMSVFLCIEHRRVVFEFEEAVTRVGLAALELAAALVALADELDRADEGAR